MWLFVSEREVGSEGERVEDPRREAEEVDQRVEIPEAHDEHGRHQALKEREIHIIKCQF